MQQKLPVFLAVGVIAVMVAMLAGPVQATPITLTNNSFQTTVVADGASTTTISGWHRQTVPLNDSHLQVYNPTSADFSGADGNGALPSPAAGSQAMFNSYTYGNDCGFYSNSTPNFVLQAGTTYTVTVAIGQGLTLHGGSYGGVDSGVDVVVKLGFYDYMGGHISNQLVVPTSLAPAPGTFQDFSVSFNADAVISPTSGVSVGDNLAVLIVLQQQVYADNVRVDASPTVPVPEPSTLVLFGVGAISLLAYGWRKRR